MAPELKIGRRVLTGDNKPAQYINKCYDGYNDGHNVLTDNGIVFTKHVKPDPAAEPMNGDEVEYGYEVECFEYHLVGTMVGEYIDPTGIKSFAVVTERGELRFCKHVRFRQQSKRDRVRELLESDLFSVNTIIDQIDYIYRDES